MTGKYSQKPHARTMETWTEHSRQLSPLRIGDHVMVPTKWDKSGIVVEVLQHHQYRIKIDGAGRCTLRNRQFLRKFTPYRSLSTAWGRDPTYRPSPPPVQTPPPTPADIQTLTNPAGPTYSVIQGTNNRAPPPPPPALHKSSRTKQVPGWHEDYLFW